MRRRQSQSPVPPRKVSARAGGGASAKTGADLARRDGVLDGLPSVMIVNRAGKHFGRRGELPWHLQFAVGYAPDASGQPTAKGARQLDAIESAVFAAVRKNSRGFFVGSTTWSGSREFHFYLEEPEPVVAALEAMAQTQIAPLEFAISEDPEWAAVAHFFDYRD